MSARGLSAAVCRLKRRAAHLLLLAPLLLFVGQGWADQPALVANPEDALSRLEQVAQTLQHGTPSDAELAALSDEVSADQSQAQDCISAQTAKTAAITAQIKALGPAVDRRVRAGDRGPRSTRAAAGSGQGFALGLSAPSGQKQRCAPGPSGASEGAAHQPAADPRPGGAEPDPGVDREPAGADLSVRPACARRTARRSRRQRPPLAGRARADRTGARSAPAPPDAPGGAGRPRARSRGGGGAGHHPEPGPLSARTRDWAPCGRSTG